MNPENQGHVSSHIEGQAQSWDPPSTVLGPQQSPSVVAADEIWNATSPKPPNESVRRLSASGAPLPTSFGRYRVDGLLGRGGFGNVYLCYDTQLHRKVAIKVPQTNRLCAAEDVDQFVREARRLAQLKHPGIVAVYDVVEDTQCYIVSDYVDGINLWTWLKDHRPSWETTARIVAAVADALAYAHLQRIVHRDVKPSNILLNRDGHPILVDFGLALSHEEAFEAPRYQTLGTPPYMSPEQARGEGHRVDGRTDIYSLGTVLYVMLCGRLPFRSDDPVELLRQIRDDEPQPPRQLAPNIPRELERICLKAMAKRIRNRYGTAGDFADELRLALNDLQRRGSADSKSHPAPAASAAAARVVPQNDSNVGRAGLPSDTQRTIHVVPRGLRSFGIEDSDFFLELLPGPRDRDGLPESIRFWKRRIESVDSERTFCTGLIYGPSGCGKSSLVKAGLLPCLSELVIPVYLEATHHETERRLEKFLRHACHYLAEDLSLKDMIASLRHAKATTDRRKVLIILDQFEQWLHVHGQDMETTELVAALRQADGVHVQTILIVRDDFWLGVSRLFNCLEINLDPEQNMRLVDLFDFQHARRVLMLLGHAFERLPAHQSELTEDAKTFLDQAVGELSQDGRVISVRLSLFAELMKERPWTRESLVLVGGTEGVGVRFLEETFTARTANPEHRVLEKPARNLLQALLPEAGTDIKGRMRSRANLAMICGLPEDSPRFVRLIDILDHELHIITPTESEEGDARLAGQQPAGDRSAVSASQRSFYQLTHDYLVPPLRHWLTMERRKTWRGRAELRLEECTSQMSVWPESRYLPSPVEFLSILFGVPSRRQKLEQRSLMREAKWFYGSRWATVAAACMIIGLIVQTYLSSGLEQTQLQDVTMRAQTLLRMPPDMVPAGIEWFKNQPKRLQLHAAQTLQQQFDNGTADPREQLRAAEALAAFGKVEQNFLVDAIEQAAASEVRNLVTALESAKETVCPKLAGRSRDERVSIPSRVRYAIMLLHLGDAQIVREMLQPNPDPVLRTTFIHTFPTWHGDVTGLSATLKDIDDDALRSGLCATLGLIDPATLGQNELSDLTAVLADQFGKSRHGGTHSAAGWALRRWQVTLPSVAAPAGARWFVNRHGMTMIDMRGGEFTMGSHIDDQATPHLVSMTRPFCMCDREVSVRLFSMFLDDPEAGIEKPVDWSGSDIRISPTPDHPVVGVNRTDAILFCNWLSTREGRTACYRRQPAVDKTDAQDQEMWLCDFEKDGYRLPTEAEWEFACRAGTATTYSFGEDESFLSHYSTFRASHCDPCASKLPNAWGFFDMLGNAQEWCWDYFASYSLQPETNPSGPFNGTQYVTRGAAFASPGEICRSAFRSRAPPTGRRAINNGFRVLCAVRNGP